MSVILSQSTIKMEKGYYHNTKGISAEMLKVAIHNKNGKGLLRHTQGCTTQKVFHQSQSTIKMEKGYYMMRKDLMNFFLNNVAIHNKNGKGLLR